MNQKLSSMLPAMSPENDPWDPIRSLQRHGKHILTSIELTVTNLCNMRCEHCAVGDALTMTEGARIPVAQVLKRLDQVEHLETISITGGNRAFTSKRFATISSRFLNMPVSVGFGRRLIRI